MVDGFHFEGGVTANNVAELRSVLADMSQDSFSRFANNEKNDFANWIRGSLRNGELADKVQNITNLDDFNKVLDEYLSAEQNDCCQLLISIVCGKKHIGGQNVTGKFIFEVRIVPSNHG